MDELLTEIGKDLDMIERLALAIPQPNQQSATILALVTSMRMRIRQVRLEYVQMKAGLTCLSL